MAPLLTDTTPLLTVIMPDPETTDENTPQVVAVVSTVTADVFKTYAQPLLLEPTPTIV